LSGRFDKNLTTMRVCQFRLTRFCLGRSSIESGSFSSAHLRAEKIRGLLALSWMALIPSAGTAPNLVRLQSNLSRIDFVVIAHQDDWQLFMGDVLTQGLRSGNRGVFVYLTAGDDGRDSAYWQTRERAALRSTRIAAGVTATEPLRCSIVQIREHPIRRCFLGNTESYFLRLPDGSRAGKGFARYGYRSLRKLRSNAGSEISAVDGSTTYKGWTDLMTTVGAVADLDSPALTVHTTDPNVARNPHDHFDHRMAGLLIADLRQQHPLSAMYYVGYALATRAANRSTVQTQEKTALLLAYDAEMMAVNKKWGAYQEHRAFYSECMQRTYVVRSPIPVIR
jgi:LmbE family N-acetylglucosaminyl deacetylase